MRSVSVFMVLFGFGKQKTLLLEKQGYQKSLYWSLFLWGPSAIHLLALLVCPIKAYKVHTAVAVSFNG